MRVAIKSTSVTHCTHEIKCISPSTNEGYFDILMVENTIPMGHIELIQSYHNCDCRYMASGGSEQITVPVVSIIKIY